jgi:uncharacterized SAM-binding protein YcdF (DUF218 family)
MKDLSPSDMLRSPPVGRPMAVLRWTAMVGAVVVIYIAANLVTVMWAATRHDSTRVQAIVVLGAAQYNGIPSPDLVARLSHALDLYRAGVAPIIVVTGGREPGDAYTEAEASADWLAARGVSQAVILREVEGRDTWESLDATAAFLHDRHIESVVLVSDPYHEERVKLIAQEVGLRPHLSSTTTSPIRGSAVVPYFVKETLEVSVGRIVGFDALSHVDRGWGSAWGLG